MNFVNLSHRRRSRLPKNGSSSFHQSISSTSRIKNREVFGICKKNVRMLSNPKQVFCKFPRRFAFPLKSLIEEPLLHEDGHVFLGFSSCNTFLISYTERIEEARHTGFLSHIYTLFWWTWNPGQKAKKVGSMRLFANEEIEYSLFLCYVEWPTLKSQIIVYGWRKFCDSCYITIATGPTLSFCKHCDLISANTPTTTSDGEQIIHENMRCAKHGFSVHFKQASGASQANVLNTSGLKIDGLLVLNIGHSIAVLCSGYLPDTMDREALPLSSIKRRACEDTVIDSENVEMLEHSDDVSSNLCCSVNEVYTSSRDAPIDALPLKNSGITEACQENCFDQSQEDDMQLQTETPPSKPSVYDLDGIEDDTCIQISLRPGQTSCGPENKENVSINFKGGELQCEVSFNVDPDPYFDPEPKSIVLRTQGAESKNSRSPEERMCRKCGCLIVSCCRKSMVELHKVGAKICGCATQTNILDIDGSVKASAEYPAVSRNKSLLPPPISGNLVLNERQNVLEVHRSELNFVTPSPTASDSSSSIHFTGDSAPASGTILHDAPERHSDGLVSFSENFYGPIEHQNVDADRPLPVGETSLHFCSMLCQGANGEMLHPLEEGDSSIQAFSQHLILDIEHVIFDILRTRCYDAYKFGYLVDYESNIMDVCAATRSVVIHVVALLNMQRSINKLPTSVAFKTACFSQQAEFILNWSLVTGRYEVVVARPLKMYDERKSGKWKGDWIVQADAAIKQQVAIQMDPYKSVYILDNSAVLHGKSLNVLWNCDKTLAITK